MGIYLNSRAAFTLYQSAAAQPYFVDKTRMLKELFPLVKAGNQHIALTRPRRFGKTVMANMIASFFSRAYDAKELFDRLYIAQDTEYEEFRNKFDVIQISFNDVPGNCNSYGQYIAQIEKRLIEDLRKEYPNVALQEREDACGMLLALYEEKPDLQLVFVLDEWDYIFHQDFITDQDKKSYLIFLRNLLKDRPYVKLAYMTGILPIAKYSSGSELNMFTEYTMVNHRKFSEYFGFCETEVDELYERYCRLQEPPRYITREDLQWWYDGYMTRSGLRIYNPRSVVLSLTNNDLANYWTSSGPYDEIFYYIRNNVDMVKDDLASMISGTPVPAMVQDYAATSQRLQTRDEIFSAMIVYGFLSYKEGAVYIPNKELMGQFSIMLQRETSLGYVHRLAKESEKMLRATLAGDTETMEEIFELAHDIESPIWTYNHETELSAVVNLVYLSARDHYRVEREDKAGKGFVDFIFYPETPMAVLGIILELKVDHTPEEAITQIKEKNYIAFFRDKTRKKTSEVLLVGIGYDKTAKKHHCKVEFYKIV